NGWGEGRVFGGKNGLGYYLVLTKSRKVVNTAKQSSQRAATSVSTARHVNIDASKPNVNSALATTYCYFKAHSLVKRPFNKKSATKTNNFNEKVNTAKVNDVTTARPKAVVSAAEGNRNNDVKSSACWIWRPKGNVIDHISKDSRSYTLKRFNYVDLQGRLKSIMAWGFLTVDAPDICLGTSPTLQIIKRLMVDLLHLEEMLYELLLKVPGNNKMYSFDLKNVVPAGGLTCLFAKATLDESDLWHRRLGHINFKTMSKLVRGNLARCLPSKIFENVHTCVAYQKRKQHKASCKTKTASFIFKPLRLLHMDLFGPVYIRSINKKTYYLVVTDEFRRFTWVFFLATKDETHEILKNFIVSIENQMDHKVKIIRCDNGSEFKNMIMNKFYEMKDFKLPTTFWAEAVNTACYVQNRVLVIKPHNKTPYELFLGRKPALSFMRPFRCPVTILNSLDHLGLKSSKDEVDDDVGSKSTKVPRKENRVHDPAKEGRQRALNNKFKSMFGQDKDKNDNMMFTNVSVAGSTYVYLGGSIPDNVVTLHNADLPIDPLMPDLEDTADTGIFSSAYDDEVEGAKADFNNLELTTVLSHILATKIHKDHPKEQIIRDPLSVLQTRRITKTSQEHAMVYRNKKDERRIVVRNKARLLAQGYTQEEGIDYDEMDVKSAFLYGTLEEKVHVYQPPSFEENRFRRGIIDKTLFIKKDKGDIMLVQVYVDDIIFGSTKKSLCTEFEGLMHKKFQMSSMRELTFFLGLQVM
nr:hypothetical protein [Tanacetum cinerariifolium]